LKNLNLNAILLLAFALLAGGAMALIIFTPGGPNGVAAVTTRGGRVFVLRFPSSVASPQQEIVVFNNETISRSRIAVLEGVEESDNTYKEVQLIIDQWQKIDNLRKKWCDQAPNYRTIRNGEPFYDIGLRCLSGGWLSTRRVMIPIEEFPDELQKLTKLFPSISPR